MTLEEAIEQKAIERVICTQTNVVHYFTLRRLKTKNSTKIPNQYLCNRILPHHQMLTAPSENYQTCGLCDRALTEFVQGVV